MDRRVVGLHQPASWAFSFSVYEEKWYRLFEIERYDDNDNHLFWVDIPSKLTGQFRFQLLEEPALAITNLPPISKADWSCLPREMVCAVFRELSLADRLKARLVCHSWAHILDNDSRAWSSITFLHSVWEIGQVLGKREFEGPYDYHWGGLNQVRDYNLTKALTFLASRRAPISALELSQENTWPGLLKDLPTLLCNLGITLKALALRSSQYLPWGQPDVEKESVVVNLIRSQPGLERLYLEVGVIGISPSMLPPLPSLRIFSLLVGRQEQVEAFRNRNLRPLLQGLDGLRLCLGFRIADIASLAVPDITTISDTVEQLGRGLKRVAGMSWSGTQEADCDCRTRLQGMEIVWGTADLSPRVAATLLHPQHVTKLYNEPNSHYRI